MRLNKLRIYTKARDWSAFLTTIDRRSATLSGFETCPGGRERLFGGTYLQSCFKCIALLLSLDKDSVSTNKRLLSRKNRFCDSKPSPTVLAAFNLKNPVPNGFQHGGLVKNEQSPIRWSVTLADFRSGPQLLKVAN